MRVQQAGFVNRDMTTQAAHKRQCSEQRALRGVTTRLQSNRSLLEHMGVPGDTHSFIGRPTPPGISLCLPPQSPGNHPYEKFQRSAFQNI